MSNSETREALKDQGLSFAEIAKEVGRRWQVLSPEAREACDKKAAAAKDKYYREFAEYKKTQNYADHQAYLVDWRAKHPPLPGSGGGGGGGGSSPHPVIC